MHDHDSGILGIPCIVELHLFPFVSNGTGVLGIYPCQDLHQSRLSCTVFPHKRMYFTLFYLKAYMVKCVYARKRFIYVFHC